MKIILITILILNTSLSWAQDSTFTLIGGKWGDCTILDLDVKYHCENAVYRTEFFNNGTYKEDGERIYDSKKIQFVTGKWSLNENLLIMDEDDGKNYKAGPNTYNIIWINENKFYSIGQEGPEGPTVYTIFQRIQ